MDTHTNTESGRCEGRMLMLIVRNQIKGERKQNKPKHRTTQHNNQNPSTPCTACMHMEHTHTHTSGSLARHSHFLLLLLLLLLLLVLLFPLLALVRETELG